MKPFRTAALAATCLMAASVSAQDYAPQVGQWELSTRLTDLSINHTSRTNNGDSTGSTSSFAAGVGIYHQLDESLKVGSSFWLSRSSARDGSGASTGSSSIVQVAPNVEFLVSGSVGVGVDASFRFDRDVSGAGALTGTERAILFSPYAFYRLPINDRILTDIRGGFGWFQEKEFDADGEETGSDSEYWFLIGAYTKYYLAENVSINFNPRLIYGKTDLENDSTDRARVSLRSGLGFSVYF